MTDRTGASGVASKTYRGSMIVAFLLGRHRRIIEPPATQRSLYPQIHDNGDAEEKRETLLHSDELHGTPPVPPLSPTLSINDELNVTLARVRSLENLWRFSGEILKILCPRRWLRRLQIASECIVEAPWP